MKLARENPALAQPIIAGHPLLQAEVVYTVREEMAATIEDVLARRVGTQFYSWRDSIHAAPVVGALMGKELQWTPEQTQSAVTTYTGKINRWLEQAGLAKENVAGTSAASSSAD
jgi:glycerol-3-phosphate dehydrogenase